MTGSPNYNKDANDDTAAFLLEPMKLNQKPQSQGRLSHNSSQLSKITNANEVEQSFASEGIWLAFNKYLFTIVLLFMATFHLNLLGFAYFLLFLVHTFTYYSFRSKFYAPLAT